MSQLVETVERIWQGQYKKEHISLEVIFQALLMDIEARIMQDVADIEKTSEIEGTSVDSIV